MNINKFSIGDRVETTGGKEQGKVIGLAVSNLGGGETPMAQVKFDREGLNYGCEGPQAGMWVEEAFLTSVYVETRPYTGRNIFGYACPKGAWADVSGGDK